MSIENKSNVLILFPGSLGDFVCALPALTEIQRRFNSDIVLAARGEALGLNGLLSFAKEIRSLEERIFSQLFSSSGLIQSEARGWFSSFSRVISWYGHSRVEVQKNLHFLMGEKYHSFPFFIGQEERHAVDYYLRCVGGEMLRCPIVHIPKNVVQWSSFYWQKIGLGISDQVLLLHPGSGGKKKRWAMEGFQRVARWWRQKRRGKVLILLGPAEDGEYAQWRPCGDIVMGLAPWQVAALLNRVDLYLGNDSGVSHLAGAVGARGTVLFGPTNPHQWKPLGGSLSILQNVKYRQAFPLTEGITLEEISEEQVIGQLTLQSGS
jgi:ADP-heptose:LPS heptosyltransferase